MIELINEDGRVVKCIETSKEFNRLKEKGFKLKEEIKQEEKKPVRKRRTKKTED